MITGHEMQDIGTAIMKKVMKEIKKSASDGGSVNKACKDAITKKGVYKYVYNVYSPTVYGRRYEGGGLADNDNLITTTTGSGSTVTVDIEDRTPAGDAGMINPPPDPVFYLSDVIEAGHEGRRWQDPDWPGPRPYMDESLDDGCAGGGEITKALEALIKNINLNV